MPTNYNYYLFTRRPYTFGSFLFDLFLTFLTGGLWLVWKLFKFLSTH